jgi:hypothetical protein
MLESAVRGGTRWELHPHSLRHCSDYQSRTQSAHSDSRSSRDKRASMIRWHNAVLREEALYSLSLSDSRHYWQLDS